VSLKLLPPYMGKFTLLATLFGLLIGTKFSNNYIAGALIGSSIALLSSFVVSNLAAKSHNKQKMTFKQPPLSNWDKLFRNIIAFMVVSCYFGGVLVSYQFVHDIVKSVFIWDTLLVFGSASYASIYWKRRELREQ
jgi:hypothetical protein